MELPKESTVLKALRRYFYSGWAFLMPYLAVYLLYYVTKWPVNPTSAGAAVANQESGMSVTHPWIPCLLHVYWVLHAVHVTLAGCALWSWWKGKTKEPGVRSQESGDDATESQGLRSSIQHPAKLLSPAPDSCLLSPDSSPLVRLAPWLLLALIFYIPGVYLEWPSDPWEHLRRINEWRVADTVGAHSCWYKSSYFIPYSMLSWCIGLRQLYWLDYYYTGICLLLCWQYYRFSRACGLGERASMVFVIIQALLFGNNIFSFYRYYGISSSIYAQLGAIALTRIVLAFASRKPFWDNPIVALRSPVQTVRSLLTPISSQPAILFAVPCLLAFTAFNHAQGIGIAGIGIAAIAVWRLREWRRPSLWFIIIGGIAANIAFLFLFKPDTIAEALRHQGWLNAWYGFNIFDRTSPAFERAIQIIGIPGYISLFAAAIFAKRDRISIYLTLAPIVILITPIFSCGFLTGLFRNNRPEDILTFQRLLFSLPPMLVLVDLLFWKAGSSERHQDSISSLLRALPKRNPAPLLATCILLAIVLMLPADRSQFNRFWHTLSIVPNDLSLSGWLSFPAGETSVRIMSQPGILTQDVTQEGATPPPRTIGKPNSGYALGLFDQVQKWVCLDQGQRVISKPTRSSDHLYIVKIESSATGREIEVRGSGPARSQWAIALDGTMPPRFFNENGIECLANLPGTISYPFTSNLIQICDYRVYSVEISVREQSGITCKVYLAIAWYDESGLLLEPNTTDGGEKPHGWSNGTYSYFGLVGEQPPKTWRTYSVRFGIGQPKAIPAKARYMRVGALLNFGGGSTARVELKRPRILETCLPNMTIFIAAKTSSTTFSSQAGNLSRHWPPQEVANLGAGSAEILAAVQK